MIQPALTEDAFVADVAEAGREPERLHVWWLGQSGFLVQWGGRRLLFDPYLSDSLTKKYARTDKPHTRMSARVVAPERLDFIDVVTSSHNHTDHLDAETLIPIMRRNPRLTFVIPEANRRFVAERLAVAPESFRGLDAGQSLVVDGFEINAIPAAHETIERDEQGRCRFLGYVVKCGPWTLYHSGDTVHFDGMEAWLRRWEIDLAFLPINGRAPERRVAGNLDGREAATLAKGAGIKIVIPCHYDMFEFNTATPELFVATATELEQDYVVLRQGERWSCQTAGALK